MTLDLDLLKLNRKEVDHVVKAATERMYSLVAVDLEKVESIHAPNFNVILPTGGWLTREQYLSAVATGYIKYLLWEPQIINASTHFGLGIVRYKSTIRISLGGYNLPMSICWHTELYQKHQGHWRATWSQATKLE